METRRWRTLSCNQSKGFKKKSGDAKEGKEGAGNAFVTVLACADSLKEKNTDPYMLHSALHSSDAKDLLGLDSPLLVKDFRPELLPGTDVWIRRHGNKGRVDDRGSCGGHGCHGAAVWIPNGTAHTYIDLRDSTPDQLDTLRLNANGTYVKPLRVAPKDSGGQSKTWNSEKGKWEPPVLEEPAPASIVDANGSAVPQVAFGEAGPSNAAAPPSADNVNASAAADAMVADEDEAANDAAGAK